MDQKAVKRGVFQSTIKSGDCSKLDLGVINESMYRDDLERQYINRVYGFYVFPAFINGVNVKAVVDPGTTKK